MPRGGLGLAALGGALTALGLPSLGLWAFAWFSLAPLIVFANKAPTTRRAALIGFVAGFFYHAVALHWLYLTCRFAQISVVLSALAVIALASVLGASWAAAAGLARMLSSTFPRIARPWLWALCWTAVAAFASLFTPRFGVDLLGYTQWSNLALIQAVSWGGPHLLDFILLLFNAALAEAWLDAAGTKAGAGIAALALALAVGVFAHGTAVLAARPSTHGPAGRIEILQPCVNQHHKWDESWIKNILAGYDELLSLPRSAQPLLVVWPETAIPRWSSLDVAVPEAARWALELKTQHLVGIIADAGSRAANAAQLIAPDGRVDSWYIKRQLVPFGEFTPLRRFLPRWLNLLDNVGDLKEGTARQPLLQTAWGPTAVIICYEAIFPRWPRFDAARGARLLINITNDAWYGDTWAPRQHYRVNRFRAIENRISVIRSGNNGVSAVIDPWGVTMAELGLDKRGRLDVQVPLKDPFPARSFYSRNGDWLGAACLALVLCACLRRALR